MKTTIIFRGERADERDINQRAVEAQLRSSAKRRVRPAFTILCGDAVATSLFRAPARDPFVAAELAIADLVGARR